MKNIRSKRVLIICGAGFIGMAVTFWLSGMPITVLLIRTSLYSSRGSSMDFIVIFKNCPNHGACYAMKKSKDRA